MSGIIYEDKLIKVEIEEFEIPWIKIFTQESVKEFSSCSRELRIYIMDAVNIVETLMLEIFSPDKINISSFGNYVPHVHFHVQARFKNDSYFPEPTWGTKQREMNIKINNLEIFYKKLKDKLNNIKEKN